MIRKGASAKSRPRVYSHGSSSPSLLIFAKVLCWETLLQLKEWLGIIRAHLGPRSGDFLMDSAVGDNRDLPVTQWTGRRRWHLRRKISGWSCKCADIAHSKAYDMPGYPRPVADFRVRKIFKYRNKRDDNEFYNKNNKTVQHKIEQ